MYLVGIGTMYFSNTLILVASLVSSVRLIFGKYMVAINFFSMYLVGIGTLKKKFMLVLGLVLSPRLIFGVYMVAKFFLSLTW